MGFQRLDQDVRRVRYTDGSEITCRSIFGIDDVQIYVPKRIREKPKVERYVYVTISCYVTVWDLQTGEVADIPGVTFPCHRDKLKDWLKGCKEVPTRQWLKDNPEHSRDYLEDNKVDIGNENRVEWANSLDPSYDCYFGVSGIVSWDEHEYLEYDTCGDMSPREDCTIGQMDEWRAPSEDSRKGCSVEACRKCFYREGTENYFIGYGPYIYRNFNIKYFDPYSNLSKRLFLCPYPAPVCIIPQGVGNPPLVREYSILACASYEKPIIMKSSAVEYDCTEALTSDVEGYLELTDVRGRVVSFFTALGSLAIDYSPVEMNKTEIQSYNLAQEHKCSDIYRLVDGVFARSHEWKMPNWCRDRDKDFDYLLSERNRFGVSWCGSPNPKTETKNWYRVLLRFYMSQPHGTSIGGFVSEDCDPYGGMWSCPDCVGEYIDIVEERYSSVHATIELEKPEEYPKKIDKTRYERPADYDSNPDGTDFCVDKKYSSLCAFPGRTKGYNEKDSKCFPFDGTYVLHALGKAVEELINNCYKDGSDDQLIVYLLEREKIKR